MPRLQPSLRGRGTLNTCFIFLIPARTTVRSHTSCCRPFLRLRVDSLLKTRLRRVTGVLKGYDQLVNLVLDETVESLRDPNDPFRLTDETRTLGMVVCRGTQVALISPTDGTEEIENPFMNAAEE